MAGIAGFIIMPNQQKNWASAFDSMLRDGTKFAQRWIPKGAAAVEKQARQTAKDVQHYRQRKQQQAKLTPRKARLLWWLPLPLIPATIFALTGGHFFELIANASAYALYIFAAMLTHSGFKQEVDQQQQQFQTSRQLPLKTFAAITVASATTLTAWAGAGHDLPIALGFGVGAFAAFVLLYGLEPRKKIIAGLNQAEKNQRLTQTLQQAEQKILSIEQAAQRINQPELNQRLTRINTLARNILTEIARDPRDLQRARKFLNTYLDGAQRVVTGFADAHQNDNSHPLEANFQRILVSIEDVFAKQHQHLLDNDLQDLDIQMEVLQTQLKHEGLN